MERAGANRTVSPYDIGGKYMANIALRPHVTDFLDVVTLADGRLELWLEETTIDEASSLVGQTVVEAAIRQRTGVTLVALLRPAAGGHLVQPSADTRLQAGDRLIVLGSRPQLAALEALAGEREGG